MIGVLGFRVWVLFALVSVLFLSAPTASATALDDYVAEPDDNYSWELVGTYNQGAFTDYVISMNSQKWDPADWDPTSGVDAPIWHHWMILTVPAVLQHETGLLVVSGGSINNSAPTGGDGLAQYLALNTQSIVVTLKQIPSEPMQFTGYRMESEDGLIAYGWRKFLEGGDARWLMRLPMTKACVRAMDTATAFMASAEGGEVTLDKYVVTGASKRGWTTWTTAAVDAITEKRVVGIVPMVIDVLNMDPSMIHHFDAYGFWSPAIWDYSENKIMEWLKTPQMAELESICDPFSYIDRLATVPKLIIAASGDEFFLPDSCQFYYSRLKGEKNMLYAPNAGHSLDGSNGDTRPEVLSGLLSWYSAILTDTARPELSWYKRYDGSLVIDTHGATPLQALQWTATNPTMRAFIHVIFGDLYESSVLQPVSPGHYVASAPAPAQGWSAFYAIFAFPSGRAEPFVVSTEISVVPDVLPYGPQYALGSPSALLDENFYKDGGASATPVRYAVRPSPSNKGRYIAFWGVHSQTNKAGLFVVTAGRPSSWLRLTSDQSNLSDAPIVWTPDDTGILVGQSRLVLPAAGQQSTLQQIPQHGTGASILDTTAMTSGNFAVANIDGNAVLLPILPDGAEDLSRQPVAVTDLAQAGVQVKNVSISADGSTLAFDDVHAGSVRDTGDVYTLRNLFAIRTAAKRTGTIVSSLAPTTLEDDNLCSIRSVESDNYAHRPSLSDDGTMVYFSEDWSNTYRAADPISALGNTNFDVMVSYGDGLETDARLTMTGSQAFAAFSHGGTRAIYAQPASGLPRLFAAPIRVTTAATTGESPFNVKAMQVAALQRFESDGSATLILPVGVDVTFPSGPQAISIETPVAPESYSRIPAGADDLPFVCAIGPDATTMTGYATLALRYNDAEMTGLDENLLTVYRLDKTANVYRPVSSPSIVHDASTNTIEIQVDRLGTYGIGGPGSVDDDRDGMSNRWEAFYGMDPYDGSDLTLDTDGDGLTALEEYQFGSAPNMEDTDGDGYWDNVERRAGSNPSSATSVPPPPTNCDVDFNGRVDAFDIQIVINNSLKIGAPSKGDVNGDNRVDATDIQMVINAVLNGLSQQAAR